MGKKFNKLRRRIEWLRCVNMTGNKVLKLIYILKIDCDNAGVENNLEEAKQIVMDTILKADTIERHISNPYYFDSNIH